MRKNWKNPDKLRPRTILEDKEKFKRDDSYRYICVVCGAAFTDARSFISHKYQSGHKPRQRLPKNK